MERRTWIVMVAIIATIVAAGFIWKSASAPTETITDYKRIIPKGAGKFDRE